MLCASEEQNEQEPGPQQGDRSKTRHVQLIFVEHLILDSPYANPARH